MAILGFELEEIARLLALLESSGMDELLIEEEGRYLRIRGPRRTRAARVASDVAAPAPKRADTRLQLPPVSTPKPSAETLPDVLPADQVALTSPMVGTFYRAEKPGAPPMITVGQHVSVGQTIGIIEAMKIFSEIPAEQAGTVVAIPAQDGQLVQAGTPLIILRSD